jgi:P2 family phage major capsid protein
MKPQTLERFTSFVGRMAEINGVSPDIAATRKFTVAPSVQQTLVTRMQETIEFLSEINIIPVDEQSGQKLGLGIGGTIAGRTNTAGGTRRAGIDPTAMDGSDYVCKQTNFDTALRYDKLDMWAKFPDFETRIRDAIVTRQALDRITIGFNGTSAADQTDREAHPLLQDVNKGWLQKMREDSPERVLSAVEGGKVAGKVSYGPNGDFTGIDAMVWRAKNALLPNGRVMPRSGRDRGRRPDRRQVWPDHGCGGRLARHAGEGRRDGRPAVGWPAHRPRALLPANAFLITTLNNLSIYYQEQGAPSDQGPARA